MRERPIIFSGPMVRAILDGRKTQTRRLLKMPEGYAFDRLLRTSINLDNAPPYGLYAQALKECTNRGTWLRCPYSDGNQGDRLWVREALRRPGDGGRWIEGWTYVADGEEVQLPSTDPRVGEMLAWAHHKEGRTCSPIHMPRWASRITLEVVGVRVQRLQEISEEDAQAEGVEPCSQCLPDRRYRHVFSRGWDTINGKHAPWASNPWVWALTFRRIP